MLKDPPVPAIPPVVQCGTGEGLGRSLDDGDDDADEHLKGKDVVLGPEHRKLTHGATIRSMRIGSLPVLRAVLTIVASGRARRRRCNFVSTVWGGKVVSGGRR